MELLSILEFWFGVIEVTDSYYQRQVPRWFMNQDPLMDQQSAAFTHLLGQTTAVRGATPQEHLAKILLFDQIPRNVFRGSKEAFAYDSVALKLTLEALGTSFESDLSFPERLFLYLPLEHAESLEMQELSVEQYRRMNEEGPVEIRKWTELALHKALEHQETIKRFGKFPNRATS